MVSFIISTLRTLPISEQARLLGSLQTYVKNDNLINLLQNYDYNNKSKDSQLMSQLSLFSGVPGLKEQVNEWLRS